MRLLFFHTLREYTGTVVLGLDLSSPIPAAGVWVELERRFPGISRFASTTRIARNREYIGPGDLLSPGDEVALIPPVSGG